MSDESPERSYLSQEAKISTEFSCPLCGGEAVNQWEKISIKIFWGFIIFAALAIISSAINCFGIMPRMVIGILTIVFIGLTILALFILPITGAIAIASRSRCQTCGHYFWPASIAPNLNANVRFPETFTVIGIVILLIVFFVQAGYINNVPGNEMIGVILEIALWIFIAWLILVVCVLCQAFFWQTIMVKMQKSSKLSVFLLLPLLILIVGLMTVPFFFRGVLAQKYDPLRRAPTVLYSAKLADLPESAHDVRVYTPRLIFSATDYLSFQAEPNDIEKFLTESPGLDGIKNDTQSSTYFHHPSWFNPDKRRTGRYYKLSEKDTSWYGELIVDDEKNVIYVYRCK